MLAMRFSKFVCEPLSELKGTYGAPAPGLTSADIEMNSVVYDAAEVSVPKHWSACMRDFVKRRDTFVVNQPMRR
jgi:hypothetical protein